MVCCDSLDHTHLCLTLTECNTLTQITPPQTLSLFPRALPRPRRRSLARSAGSPPRARTTRGAHGRRTQRAATSARDAATRTRRAAIGNHGLRVSRARPHSRQRTRALCADSPPRARTTRGAHVRHSARSRARTAASRIRRAEIGARGPGSTRSHYRRAQA